MTKDSVAKGFKLIIIVLFFLFIALYISNSTGRFEHENYRRMVLTREAIEEFEEDVRQGRNIDIRNYLDDTRSDHSNALSNTGLMLSQRTEEIIGGTINGIFRGIYRLLSNQ